MAFESESAMKSVACRILGEDFTGGPTTTIEEFSYGGGRADLVLAKESRTYREHRLEELDIDTVIDDDTYLRTFLLLHSREAISKEHFYSLGAIDKSTKKGALEWLMSHGFVVPTPSGKIKTAPRLRRHITRSYSIELKLDKWQQALKQAFRAKSFSDYQFVALDDDKVIPAIDNIERFDEHGVGLLSINEDREEYTVHYNPERDNPYSPIHKWRLNERTMWEEANNPIYAD